MSNIEILCCNNDLLKYHDYCKYYNIHFVTYSSEVQPNSQAYGNVLYHMSRNLDVFRMRALQFV